jgi:hypothetical protein
MPTIIYCSTARRLWQAVVDRIGGLCTLRFMSRRNAAAT